MRKEATMRPPLPPPIRYAFLGIFLAAATAVFATENVWTARGPDGISWVNDAAIADGKASAGTRNGVFRSMDEGASWQSLGLAGRWIDQIAVGGGTRNFWFFHSNLTSLDYSLTLTDQVSGAVRTFQSPGSFCGDANISLEPD
jgi:hypothetical protein